MSKVPWMNNGKKIGIIVIASVCAVLVLTLGILGIRKHDASTVSGSYEADTGWGKIVYTFDGKDVVNVKYESMSKELYSQSSTYQIDDDGKTIVLAADKESTVDAFKNAYGALAQTYGFSSYLPDNYMSFSGTYTFHKDKDSIIIGNVCYDKINPKN